MKVLITGAKGFVGRNLAATLQQDASLELLCYDADSAPALLDEYCKEADFVFHLAGVNRPKDPEEFMRGNFGFTSMLLTCLKAHHNPAPVLVTSSVQAALDNPYGRSKKAGEELIAAYGAETGASVYIYRLPNVFGKWCRPNYNSAVATFCHNIARELPITVNDRGTQLTLVYIDDVVAELESAMRGAAHQSGAYCYVPVTHTKSLGEIVDLLYSFRDGRSTLSLPQLDDPFTQKLYATYLSFLPEDEFAYPLTMHSDARGCFTEMLRTPERGQIGVNTIRAGFTKGNHWHHTKSEKYLTVYGRGLVRLRRVGEERILEYPVCAENLEVLEIPAGYVHNITNTGTEDMVTVMWASECFDPERPDTYYEEV